MVNGVWCAAGQGNEWCDCDAARPDQAWGLLITLNFTSVAGAFSFSFSFSEGRGKREEGRGKRGLTKTALCPLSLDAFISIEVMSSTD